MCLWCCWKDRGAGFNGIYLVRFGFRMLEILTFKRFLQLKIQINSQKPGFGRKNQLRTSSNLGQRYTGHTSSYEKNHRGTTLPYVTQKTLKYSNWGPRLDLFSGPATWAVLGEGGEGSCGGVLCTLLSPGVCCRIAWLSQLRLREHRRPALFLASHRARHICYCEGKKLF
jgi:hypothetical protein